MEWIEMSGASIEEAEDRALDVLGVHHDEAEFEVLEVPKIGLLGRVKGQARVRARIRPIEASSQDGRDRKRPRRDREKDKEKSGSRGDTEPAKASGPAQSSRQKSTSRQERPAAPAADETPIDPVPVEELAAVGVEFLGGLVRELGFEATVAWTQDEDRLDFSVTGTNLGVLVGRGGRTVDGVQEVTRAVLLKAAKGTTDVRIGVDIGGYRAFRNEALSTFGIEVANRAVESGTTIALDPMNSIDRKIVHTAVQSVSGAASSSEGTGDGRRVVVHPAE